MASLAALRNLVRYRGVADSGKLSDPQIYGLTAWACIEAYWGLLIDPALALKGLPTRPLLARFLLLFF